MLQRALIDIRNFKDLKSLEKFLINDKLYLKRSTKVEQERLIHYEKIGYKGKKIGKWMRNKLFSECDATDGSICSEKAVLTLNDFPVDLPPGVQHWLVWIDDYYISKPEALQLCDSLFLLKGWKKENIIVFEKIKKRRSVPEIRHFHVYVKVK